MADTTSLHINFANRDLDKFNDVLKSELHNGVFWDEVFEDEKTLNATIYEANKAWTTQLSELAEAGLTFEGSHGSGAEYDSGLFTCFQGELIELPSSVDGAPYVVVNREGIDQEELIKAMEYYKILDRVEKHFNA